jgi:hypothetical protein
LRPNSSASRRKKNLLLNINLNNRKTNKVKKTYDITWVLGCTKSSLKKKIWSRSEGSPEARADIILLNSRRGPLFTLDEISDLAGWLEWHDAARDGHEGCATPLTEWRDRQAAKAAKRAAEIISRLRNLEATSTNHHNEQP